MNKCICLLLLVTTILLTGCGGDKTIDATNAEKLANSISRTMEDMTAQEQKSFTQDLLLVHNKNTTKRLSIHQLFPKEFTSLMGNISVTLLNSMALNSSAVLSGQTPSSTSERAREIRIETYNTMLSASNQQASKFLSARILAEKLIIKHNQAIAPLIKKRAKLDALKAGIMKNFRYAEVSRKRGGYLYVDATVNITNTSRIPVQRIQGRAYADYTANGKKQETSGYYVEFVPDKPLGVSATWTNAKAQVRFQGFPQDAVLNNVRLKYLTVLGIKQEIRSGRSFTPKPLEITGDEKKAIDEGNSSKKYCETKIKSLDKRIAQWESYSRALQTLITEPSASFPSEPGRSIAKNYCR
jgi:hypothetical protein